MTFRPLPHVLLIGVTALLPATSLAGVASSSTVAGNTSVASAAQGERAELATAAHPTSADRSASLGIRLRQAIAPLQSDPAVATESLQKLLPDGALLEDVVLYYLGLAERAHDPEEARQYLQRALAFPDSVVAPHAAAELAELFLDSGDAEAIAQLASRFGLPDGSDPESVARISLAAGKAYATSDPRKASEYLMEARRAAPAMEPGETAASLLAGLRKAHPELRPASADAIYDEAALAGREGKLGEQIALLDRFLAEYPNDRRVTEAALSRGRALARQASREQAATWLEARAATAATGQAKAQFLYAAAVQKWNTHDSDGALAQFETMLDLKSGVSDEQRAWYAIGRIHEAERRYTAAAAAYRKAALGRDDELRRESRWRAGWVSYLAGNYDGAAWVFGAMADESRTERGAASGLEEALYWEGRSLEKAGRREEAKGVYRTLLRDVPDGYYAFLVERRMSLAAEPPRVAPLATTQVGLPPAVQTGLDRARELSLAGLDAFAVDELSRIDAGAAPDVRRALLPHMLEMGAYSEALRSSLRLYQRGLLSEDQLYPYLYPHAFADIVAREADSRSVDPFLVYSLIRQESLFDRRAVSPAAAYGLMQLLLPTARRMAPRAGLSQVDLADLFEPEINVRLGVTYLAELSKRFDNNPVLMLASYNAGERAADRWQSRLAGLELDEFVEQISYSETRNYVKKILRNYRNYRRLYGDAGVATGSEQAQ